MRENLKTAQTSLNSLKSSFDENSDELKGLESKFYQGTFSDPKSEFIFTKITNRNICLVCNNHVSEKRVAEVVKKVNKHHECPVCSSNLTNVDEEVHSLTDREIKRLESLSLIVKNAYPDIKRIEKECNALYTQIEENNKNIVTVDNTLTELNFKIADNTNKLDQIIQASETPITNFDFAIAELQKQIDAYRQTTEPLLVDYNRIKKLMEKKNEDLNKTINNFNKRLADIFGNLAKSYFGDSCSLVLNSRRPRGFEVPLSYFIPILKGKERFFQTRVSKSQAIFLEYLFRLSLLKLYHENTKIKPFLFLETSEGSFDVSNTALMADTLTQIGKMGFPFVIITNLSKIDFILRLLPDVTERRKRTFNLLDYAHDSIFDGRSKPALMKALKALNLN